MASSNRPPSPRKRTSPPVPSSSLAGVPQSAKGTESRRRKPEEHESRLTKREDVLDRKLDTRSVKEKNLDDLDGCDDSRTRRI